MSPRHLLPTLAVLVAISPDAPPLIDTLRVNDVLRLYPATAAAFNALAIDACCGGERTLAQAAREDGVALDALLAALRWSIDDEVRS